MDRGVGGGGEVTHLHRSLNCVLEVVQCICIIISDQPFLFRLLLCSHFFFSFKKRKPLFSNPIEMKYLTWIVTVYQPTS